MELANRQPGYPRGTAARLWQQPTVAADLAAITGTSRTHPLRDPQICAQDTMLPLARTCPAHRASRSRPLAGPGRHVGAWWPGDRERPREILVRSLQPSAYSPGQALSGLRLLRGSVPAKEGVSPEISNLMQARYECAGVRQVRGSSVGRR